MRSNPSLHPTCYSGLRPLPQAGELKRYGVIYMTTATFDNPGRDRPEREGPAKTTSPASYSPSSRVRGSAHAASVASKAFDAEHRQSSAKWSSSSGSSLAPTEVTSEMVAAGVQVLRASGLLCHASSVDELVVLEMLQAALKQRTASCRSFVTRRTSNERATPDVPLP